MDDLTKRAFAAYFKAGGDDQPSNASGLVELGGKRYVVLHSGASVLAVYRVRNNGILKRMVRWPAQLGPAKGVTEEVVAEEVMEVLRTAAGRNPAPKGV